MDQNCYTAQDKYPELSLVPTTYCSKSIKIWLFEHRFDYVQDIKRNNSSESFHILYKDGKFGVLMHQSGCLWSTSKIALPAKYDNKIDFIEKNHNSFIAIISADGKFGLYFWKNGILGSDKYLIPTIYDSISFEDEKKRFRAIKGDAIIFFDMTGHSLK